MLDLGTGVAYSRTRIHLQSESINKTVTPARKILASLCVCRCCFLILNVGETQRSPIPREMITRSKLVEQLRDYQIRSQNKCPALTVFSPKPHIASWYVYPSLLFFRFVLVFLYIFEAVYLEFCFVLSCKTQTNLEFLS